MKTGNQKGFTLTEMMASLGISTIIVYSIFTVIRVTGDQIDTTGLKMTIQSSARDGLYRMTQEIRESAPSKITVGTGGTSVTFYVPKPTAPVTSSYDIDWTNAYQIKYALGGTGNKQIIRTNLTTNQTTVVANDVTALTFTGNTSQPTDVTVAMSVQRALVNGRNVPATAMQMTGQAKVRNVSSGGSDDEDDDHSSDDDHESDHSDDDHESDHDDH